MVAMFMVCLVTVSSTMYFHVKYPQLMENKIVEYTTLFTGGICAIIGVCIGITGVIQFFVFVLDSLFSGTTKTIVGSMLIILGISFFFAVITALHED